MKYRLAGRRLSGPTPIRYAELPMWDETNTLQSSVLQGALEPPVGLVVVTAEDVAFKGVILPIDEPLVVGRRSRENTGLVVRDSALSRQHLRVTRVSSDTLFVEDLESKNGTYVNGQRTSRSKLGAGDVLSFGGNVAVVEPIPTSSDEFVASDGAIGRSFVFQQTRILASAYAPSDAAVLLLGETGSGKEVMARTIHQLSGRKGEFVAVNCASLPKELIESALFGHIRGAFTGATESKEGYFRAAEGGTIFLDEIGDMPMELQVKLLRALDSGGVTPVGATKEVPVNARVVAATNVDLSAAMEGGTFRRDLYARIATGIVRLPSLSMRRSDIPLLLERFLRIDAPERRYGFSAGCMTGLLLHPWRLNVRELRSVARRITLTWPEGELGTHALAQLLDLPGTPAVPDSQDASTDEVPGMGDVRALDPAPKFPRGGPSADELRKLLGHYRGTVSKLAAHYDTDRKTVYRWLDKHAIVADSFRK